MLCCSPPKLPRCSPWKTPPSPECSTPSHASHVKLHAAAACVLHSSTRHSCSCSKLCKQVLAVLIVLGSNQLLRVLICWMTFPWSLSSIPKILKDSIVHLFSIAYFLSFTWNPKPNSTKSQQKPTIKRNQVKVQVPSRTIHKHRFPPSILFLSSPFLPPLFGLPKITWAISFRSQIITTRQGL